MRPRKLSLGIHAWRPEPVTFKDGSQDDRVERDGQAIVLYMDRRGGDAEVSIYLRQGMAPATAVATLRKVIALINRHGADLLNRPYQESNIGSLTKDGGVAWSDDDFDIERDDEGNMKGGCPEIY